MNETEQTILLPLRDALAATFFPSINAGDAGTVEQAAKELNIAATEYDCRKHWPVLVARKCYAQADAFLAARGTPTDAWIPLSRALASANRHWSDDSLGCMKVVGVLSKDASFTTYWSVGAERAMTLEAYAHWLPLPGDPAGPEPAGVSRPVFC